MASRFSISAIFRSLDRMTKPAREMSAGVARFAKSAEKSVSGLNKQLGAVDEKLRSVGKGLLVAGAIGAAGAVVMGKAGADFEEAISGVGAVSLMTRDQIRDLEKEALRLGATTKFTATEAANAMEVMARAGFTNAEVLAGVGGILNAAAAEGAEMAEVANHVSNVLKGMGLEAAEAGRVSDVLALASARTNSSIGSLGESMKNLSPVAKQFGISLEDAVGMVALLQDVGLDASEAGTATATMLTKLAKPADEVASKMEEMGVVFKDAAGNMLPPLEVFNNMRKAADKLGGNMDQVAFFADLVGLRGQKAALNLKDLFASDKGQKLTEELKNARGSAEKMAALRMDNLKGDLTILSSTVEGLQVALFQTESGPLRGIVQGFTEWLSVNKDLIVSGFVEFMTDIRDSLPQIVAWIERIGKVLAVFYAFRVAVMLVTGALKALSFVAALNPWVALAYGLVAAVALIWAFWPEISAFFAGLWDSIVEFGGKAWDWLGRTWDGLVSLGGKAIDAVVGFFSGLWGAVRGPLTAFGEFVVGLFRIALMPATLIFKLIAFVAGWVAAKVVALWEPVGEKLGQLWAGIVSAVQAAVAAISEVVGQVAGWLGEAWDYVAEIASAVWTTIADEASTAYTKITTAFEPIRAFFKGIWDSIASGFKSALGWVLEKVQWLVDHASTIVNVIRAAGRESLDGEGAPAEGPSTIDPNGAVVRELRENRTSAEVTIKSDKPMALTKKPTGPGLNLGLAPSGAV